MDTWSINKEHIPIVFVRNYSIDQSDILILKIFYTYNPDTFFPIFDTVFTTEILFCKSPIATFRSYILYPITLLTSQKKHLFTLSIFVLSPVSWPV